MNFERRNHLALAERSSSTSLLTKNTNLEKLIVTEATGDKEVNKAVIKLDLVSSNFSNPTELKDGVEFALRKSINEEVIYLCEVLA